MNSSPKPDAAIRQEVPADFLTRIDDLQKRSASPEYDLAVQARAVGSDTNAIFHFVRDRIRYEAYSGVLRGADGTLAAGAGNAFDRSLLLANLLRDRGTAVRFAACELTSERAAALYRHIFDGGLDTSPDEWPNDTSAFLARVVTRARRDFPAIRAAAGNIAAGAAGAARTQAVSDARRHVWIQARVNGAWKDLDTAFPGSEPGETFCASQQVVETMPVEWYQQVVIRVTSERIDDNALRTTPALSATMRAVDLIGEVVFLTHIPAKAQGAGLSLGLSGVGAGGDGWAPVLLVGPEIKAGQAIDYSDDAGSGLADALSGGGASSILVSECLEIEFLQPGGRRDVTRRVLFDRAGAAWRASAAHDVGKLQALERNETGPLVAQSIHNLLFSAGPQDLAAFGDAVRWSANAEEPASDMPAYVALYPLAVRNFATLLWADHLIVPALSTRGVRFYADSPRLAIVSSILEAGNSVSEVYDLRRDRLLGVAVDSQSESLVADQKLKFAALEGALEHEAAARDTVAAGADPAQVVSTSSLLQSGGLIALDAADESRLDSLTRDAEKVARLRTALQEGRALVPKQVMNSGPLGFWVIAPSGDARAVLGEDLNGSWGLPNRGTYGLSRSPSRTGGTYRMPNSPGGAKRGKIELSPARPGDEYTILILGIVNPSIVAVSALAVVVHEHHRQAELAAYDAWNAAEQAKQDRALRAAGVHR